MTILGNSGAFPHSCPCSGYLIEDTNTRVLLECGSGILLNLKKFCEVKDLSGIIISHLHWDHCSDLMTLRYEIDHLQQKGDLKAPIPLYCPDEPDEIYRMLPYKDTLKIHTINSDTKFKIGQMTIEFFKVQHPLKSYGLNVYKNGDKKLCYSSDTSDFKGLYEAASGAQMFICEATGLHKEKDTLKGHMTGKQAAAAAQKSGVSRLVLTHFWPYHNPDLIVEEAQEEVKDLKIIKALPEECIEIK